MTQPMTRHQIATCRALLDRLADMPPDPWSEEIHARALARARRERLAAVPDPGQADINAAGRAAVEAALKTRTDNEEKR